MMHGCGVDGTIRIPVPMHIVDEFGDHVFVVANIPDMGLVQFPPVIIYLLNLFIRTFKKRNIIKIPLGIFLVIFVGQFVVVKYRKVIFFMTTGQKNPGDTCEQEY